MTSASHVGVKSNVKVQVVVSIVVVSFFLAVIVFLVVRTRRRQASTGHISDGQREKGDLFGKSGRPHHLYLTGLVQGHGRVLTREWKKMWLPLLSRFHGWTWVVLENDSNDGGETVQALEEFRRHMHSPWKDQRFVLLTAPSHLSTRGLQKEKDLIERTQILAQLRQRLLDFVRQDRRKRTTGDTNDTKYWWAMVDLDLVGDMDMTGFDDAWQFLREMAAECAGVGINTLTAHHQIFDTFAWTEPEGVACFDSLQAKFNHDRTVHQRWDRRLAAPPSFTPIWLWSTFNGAVLYHPRILDQEDVNYYPVDIPVAFCCEHALFHLQFSLPLAIVPAWTLHLRRNMH